MLSLSTATLVTVLALTFLLWLVSLVRRDASIIDIFWGTGFVCIAWVGFILGPQSPRALILNVLVTLWGLRLSIYLWWRNHGKGEDYRYQAMRKRHTASFPIRSLFTVFWLQALLMWLIAVPIRSVQAAEATPLGIFDIIGAVLWVSGLFFESVGDWQLARFKADPANQGKIMNRGLWAWTRHPNYFGDAVLWWGFFCFAIPIEGGIYSFYGPLIMNIFLVKISGAALLERNLVKRRPGYDEYLRTTSPFIPRPPRRGTT